MSDLPEYREDHELVGKEGLYIPEQERIVVKGVIVFSDGEEYLNVEFLRYAGSEITSDKRHFSFDSNML